MLGKLIKYELKATSRWFLPMYALALLLSTVERFMIRTTGQSFHLPAPFNKIAANLLFIITVAFVIALFAICFASVFLIIYRFYKNLITNEGYLMHTLPVKASQLIWSKTVAAVLWILASVIVIFLALTILFSGTDGWQYFWSDISAALSTLRIAMESNSNFAKILVEFFLSVAAGGLSSIFMLYASIALGQLVTKHKILGAFGAYFALYLLMQFVSSLLFLPLITGMGNSITQVNSIAVLSNFVFPVLFLTTAAWVAVYYFITLWVFKKKLNLE